MIEAYYERTSLVLIVVLIHFLGLSQFIYLFFSFLGRQSFLKGAIQVSYILINK